MNLTTTIVGITGLAIAGVVTPSSNLPQQLAAIGEKVSCSAVPDFFDRPGMVEPPFLYGYRPGAKEATAAFWCVRREDRVYLLVTMRHGRLSSYFPWLNYPGGLSLATRSDWELSDFRYVDDPQESGPAGAVSQYRPLQNYYDGVVTLFYEHDGRWLYRISD